MKFSCECGQQTKSFKYDIGGSFRDSCCELAEASAQQREKDEAERQAAQDDEDPAGEEEIVGPVNEAPATQLITLPILSQEGFSGTPDIVGTTVEQVIAPADFDVNKDGKVDGEDLKAIQAEFKAKGLTKSGKQKKKPGRKPSKKAGK